jgi:hypothetical protein
MDALRVANVDRPLLNGAGEKGIDSPAGDVEPPELRHPLDQLIRERFISKDAVNLQEPTRMSFRILSLPKFTPRHALLQGTEFLFGKFKAEPNLNEGHNAVFQTEKALINRIKGVDLLSSRSLYTRLFFSSIIVGITSVCLTPSKRLNLRDDSPPGPILPTLTELYRWAICSEKPS